MVIADALHGVWRSLVARMVWDHEAVGSSPTTPTSDRQTGNGQHKPAAGHFM